MTFKIITERNRLAHYRRSAYTRLLRCAIRIRFFIFLNMNDNTVLLLRNKSARRYNARGDLALVFKQAAPESLSLPNLLHASAESIRWRQGQAALEIDNFLQRFYLTGFRNLM